MVKPPFGKLGRKSEIIKEVPKKKLKGD